MGFVDGMKVISEPLCKLIDAISKAIGKSYEPRYIKKLADAKAYEIEKISEAMRNNSDLPIVYNGNEPAIDTTNYEALRLRAGYRLAYQEISKQENIESIVEQACIELDGKELESKEEISPEWMNRFINMAGEISTEEMQHIWAKVLAGEVVKPNTYSMKTLECLRNLSKKDAELFTKISKFIISDCTLFNNSEINQKYNINYADILALDDCGLINSGGTIAMNCQLDSNKSILIHFGEYCLLGCSDKEQRISYASYPLTRAGRELLLVARDENMDIQYIKDIVQYMNDKYPNVRFSVHKVLEKVGNNVKYDTNDITL